MLLIKFTVHLMERSWAVIPDLLTNLSNNPLIYPGDKYPINHCNDVDWRSLAFFFFTTLRKCAINYSPNKYQHYQPVGFQHFQWMLLFILLSCTKQQVTKERGTKIKWNSVDSTFGEHLELHPFNFYPTGFKTSGNGPFVFLFFFSPAWISYPQKITQPSLAISFKLLIDLLFLQPYTFDEYALLILSSSQVFLRACWVCKTWKIQTN